MKILLQLTCLCLLFGSLSSCARNITDESYAGDTLSDGLNYHDANTAAAQTLRPLANLERPH